MAGDSIVETIRDYGEMFTGKLKGGTIPSFVTDSFSPEYLKYHPNLLQELPQIIEQGNLRYIKAMLRDIATEKFVPYHGTKIPPLDGSLGKIDYLSKVDTRLLKQAKQELAQENSNFLAEFTKNVKDNSRNYPQLSSLL